MLRIRKLIAVILMGVLLAFLFAFNPGLGGIQETLSAQPIQEAEDQGTIFLPMVIGLEGDGIPAEPPAWLDKLNGFRREANLPALTLNSDWAVGGWNHSRYMVKNNEIAHSEDPDRPWYTPEGDQAARSSNLLGSTSTQLKDQTAIGLWMAAPFHALGILDPRLQQVGFGSFREQDGGIQMGAALDVLRGREAIPEGLQFPISWPADGSTVSLNSYGGGEYPDPLSPCAGYQTPVGLPVILQVGPGDTHPNLEKHTIRQGMTELAHCIFDETSYTNSDEGAQSLGRRLLSSHDALVLIPRQPLIPGRTYTVSITADGKDYTWSFQVDLKLDADSENLGEIILR